MHPLVSLVLTAAGLLVGAPAQVVQADVSGSAHRVLAAEASGHEEGTAGDDPVGLPDGITTEDWATVINDLTLAAASLPRNSFGVFLTSQTQGFVTSPGGSAGDLCLGGAIGRYFGPGQVQNSGTGGEIDLVLDLTMTPLPTGLVSVLPGDTWNFQAWYRDAIGGVATSNFTDGLEILFW